MSAVFARSVKISFLFLGSLMGGSNTFLTTRRDELPDFLGFPISILRALSNNVKKTEHKHKLPCMYVSIHPFIPHAQVFAYAFPKPSQAERVEGMPWGCAAHTVGVLDGILKVFYGRCVCGV